MASEVRTVFRSERVYIDDRFKAAQVHVEGGRIAAIKQFAAPPPDGAVVEDVPFTILPGLVDTHVHINEPGRTEWEGFATATRAAAAGGITSVVDMPLNCIPATTSLSALHTKQAAAQGNISIDVAMWGGVVPGNVDELFPMRRAGVPGFKCFMVESGVPEFELCREEDLRKAMPVLTDARAVLLAHAEDPDVIAMAEAALAKESFDPNAYSTYLRSRPPEAEHEAIKTLIRLSEEFGTRVHIVHFACANALPDIERAKAAGLPITVETCPHYLSFEAEKIPYGNTPYKCAPPIREREHREALWGALHSGIIDIVVSDHSPCTPALKRMGDGDFMKAWGGVASLQLGLSAIYTEAKRRDFTLRDVMPWVTRGPARLAKLRPKKGVIEEGADADLVFFDENASFEVRGEALQHRHDVTPYEGMVLDGVVRATFLRGELVFDGDVVIGQTGELLTPTAALRSWNPRPIS